MTAVRVVPLVFLAAVLQASVLSGVDILGGTPDLALVVVVSVALCRGSVAGAGTGFFTGLLLDTASLETLGTTSLLLTLVGYWVGRYGETRARASTWPAVVLATAGYALGALALRFVLGKPASAYQVLVATLVQTVALNLILVWPVHALVRRLVPPPREAQAEGVGAYG